MIVSCRRVDIPLPSACASPLTAVHFPCTNCFTILARDHSILIQISALHSITLYSALDFYRCIILPLHHSSPLLPSHHRSSPSLPLHTTDVHPHHLYCLQIQCCTQSLLLLPLCTTNLLLCMPLVACSFTPVICVPDVVQDTTV